MNKNPIYEHLRMLVLSSHRSNVSSEVAKEIEEVIRKAEAFDKLLADTELPLYGDVSQYRHTTIEIIQVPKAEYVRLLNKASRNN